MKNESEKWKWKSLSHVQFFVIPWTVPGILQARILEWVAFPFSRVSSNPGIAPRYLALQTDSLPAEPQGKPKFPYKIRNESQSNMSNKNHYPSSNINKNTNEKIVMKSQDIFKQIFITIKQHFELEI